MASNAPRSSGSAHSLTSGIGLLLGSATATSKQNDRRRISNDHAVDLVATFDLSTRTVASGNLRHSWWTRSTMSVGISTGAPAPSSDWAFTDSHDVRLMVEVRRRHPVLNVLNTEAVAAALMLGAKLVLSPSNARGQPQRVLPDESIAFRRVDLP